MLRPLATAVRASSVAFCTLAPAALLALSACSLNALVNLTLALFNTTNWLSTLMLLRCKANRFSAVVEAMLVLTTDSKSNPCWRRPGSFTSATRR